MDSRQSARSVLYGRSSAAKRNLLHRDKIREGRFLCPMARNSNRCSLQLCANGKNSFVDNISENAPRISAAKERGRRTGDLQEGRKEKRCPMIVS